MRVVFISHSPDSHCWESRSPVPRERRCHFANEIKVTLTVALGRIALWWHAIIIALWLSPSICYWRFEAKFCCVYFFLKTYRLFQWAKYTCPKGQTADAFNWTNRKRQITRIFLLNSIRFFKNILLVCDTWTPLIKTCSTVSAPSNTMDALIRPWRNCLPTRIDKD